jgi:hypothetical protein
VSPEHQCALAALAAVALLGTIGWRLAVTLAPGDGPGARAGLALVLGTALLCGGYGLLGQLCARAPAEVELVFHGETAAAPRTSRSEHAGELRVIDDRVTRARATPAGLLVFAGTCFLAALALPPRRRSSRRAPAWPSWAPLLWVPIGLAVFGALRSTPRGYDALWYHLPTAAAFARAGHLEPPGRDLVFYFPGNLELVARTLFDLTGRANAMTLAQLPFALALAPLCAAIARRLGAGRAAFFAGALALACPMVVFQSGLAYADLLAAAGLAAALLLVLDAIDATGPGRALALAGGAGAALGVSLGAKYAALPLVATGLPVLLCCALARRVAPVRALALTTVLLAGLAVPAWFWYLRNLRLTGNPIFPIAVPEWGLPGLFFADAFNRGKELELVRTRAEWLAYPWLEVISHESGFGAAFAALVPPSLPVLALACLRRVRHARLPRLALPLGWGLLYLCAWWLNTPHEVRHLLPLVILLGAPATVLLRGGHARAAGLRRVASAALAISGLVTLRLQLFSPVPELSVALAGSPTEFATFYGLPQAVLAGLPPGSRVANLATRPYNFALLGPEARFGLYDYAPPPFPSDAALRDRGATHVSCTAGSLSSSQQRPHHRVRHRIRTPGRSGVRHKPTSSRCMRSERLAPKNDPVKMEFECSAVTLQW